MLVLGKGATDIIEDKVNGPLFYFNTVKEKIKFCFGFCFVYVSIKKKICICKTFYVIAPYQSSLASVDFRKMKEKELY